jgi:hypothetical protein
MEYRRRRQVVPDGAARLGKEARMRGMGPWAWCGIVLACLIAGGCHKSKQKSNRALSASNYRQKFDQVEAAYRARPGELGPGDIEAILGLGEPVPAGHGDLASPPPGVAVAAMSWSRWAYRNEVLLVGFADSRAGAVLRLRR